MSSEGRGLTKWQVAALSVGAVAVVAGGALVAYACVKGRSRRRSKPDATPQSDQGTKPGTGSQSEEAAASKPKNESEVSADLAC